MSKEMKKYREGVVERAKKLDKREMGLLQDMRALPEDDPLECAIDGEERISKVRLEASLKGVLIELAERWTDSREHLIARGMRPDWSSEMHSEPGTATTGRRRFIDLLGGILRSSDRRAA